MEIIVKKILNIFHLHLSPKKEKLFLQIIKFLIVGGTATIIDWITYYILYNYVNIPPLIANILSFSTSVIYNYYASVHWVFDVNKNKSQKKMFTEFMILSIVGLLIAELLLWIFINLLRMDAMISKIISTVIVMIFNFITRKVFLE